VRGHYHPRDPHIRNTWDRLQVPVIDVHTVRNKVDLLIVDNSSLGYEMLHLGRGVISLNAPWYRRDVHHGLRFWDAVPGIQVDEPEELIALDFNSALVPPSLEPAVAAYDSALSDGKAGLRAAAWVTQLIHGL